ncbi:hypothetical protein M9Y10_007524 [Tritrichomonas musculus]|uniref:Uncharacterized protein n=1 Tax=Tritrichomonas musculus TaxID=1915356 RepID=A0ABR2J1K6_9EUKA
MSKLIHEVPRVCSSLQKAVNQKKKGQQTVLEKVKMSTVFNLVAVEVAVIEAALKELVLLLIMIITNLKNVKKDVEHVQHPKHIVHHAKQAFIFILMNVLKNVHEERRHHYLNANHVMKHVKHVRHPVKHAKHAKKVMSYIAMNVSTNVLMEL